MFSRLTRLNLRVTTARIPALWLLLLLPLFSAWPESAFADGFAREAAAPSNKPVVAAPNVLFIIVDDLRAAGASFGAPQIKTPSLDTLARRGTAFQRAYCQQALCSPSRTSFLTGRRPDTTQVIDLVKHFRDTIPDVVTLPQYFKNHGYHTQAVGKTYHNGKDDKLSWSAPHWMPRGPKFGGGVTDPDNGRGPAWEASTRSDRELPDGQTADRAIELLNQLKGGKFFLAVGFNKPHLPFIAPASYFDLYPPSAIKLPVNNTPPVGVPEIALNWGELRAYDSIPKIGDVPEAKAKELIRAYYAATSYADAQIGRVLAELDRLKLRDNTIVVLLGDHGFSLNEQAMWTKHSNFEVVLQVPLILSVPGQKKVNQKTDGLVELVDLYPTLVDAAGLPMPAGLEGISFMPLVADPKRAWKRAAFSQFTHRRPGKPRSLRTARYRYVEYTTGEKELYDFQQDPLGLVNIAKRPEMASNITELSKLLHDGWQTALPAGVKLASKAGAK